jgi:hypothetical protein
MAGPLKGTNFTSGVLGESFPIADLFLGLGVSLHDCDGADENSRMCGGIFDFQVDDAGSSARFFPLI